jgi:murein peptide amidase A
MERWRDEEIGRSRRGAPIRVFLPARPEALLIAGVHGDEPETVWLARRLLERIDGDEATIAIIACANPDGVADSIRQNAAGVDLNRNYPSASWLPDDSFTYPPGTPFEDRLRDNRTSRSGPGEVPGSEPETQAVLDLIERLAPGLIVDLHAPLELVLPTADAPMATVEELAHRARLPITMELGSRTPGALRDWCADRGLPAITYEVEHAGLPALGARHLPALEWLVRGSRSSRRRPG